MARIEVVYEALLDFHLKMAVSCTVSYDIDNSDRNGIGRLEFLVVVVVVVVVVARRFPSLSHRPRQPRPVVVMPAPASSFSIPPISHHHHHITSSHLAGGQTTMT